MIRRKTNVASRLRGAPALGGVGASARAAREPTLQAPYIKKLPDDLRNALKAREDALYKREVAADDVFMLVAPSGVAVKTSYATSKDSGLRDLLRAAGFFWLPDWSAWVRLGKDARVASNLLARTLEKSGLSVTRVGFNPRRMNGAEALPKVNRKRKNTKRLGGVEATYAGRIAGRCLAVSATGAEYMLDPEAVAHAGLREGTALIVRAVPGDFATFRKTVASPKKRKNGAKSVADPVAARELELYIENEGALVAAANSMGRMIMRNLAGMITRGTYDSTKAWKAWMPLADEGAKRYTREYGDRFGTVFNKATREMVANALAEAFESEVRTGAINLATLLAPRANRRR